jgi:ribosomal protein S1
MDRTGETWKRSKGDTGLRPVSQLSKPLLARESLIFNEVRLERTPIQPEKVSEMSTDDRDTSPDVTGEETQAEMPAELPEEGPTQMKDAMNEMGTPKELTPGDIVEGIVAAVGDLGVSVAVGAKFEGLVPRAEFPREEDLPKLDERIMVAVVRVDEEHDVIMLSKKRADYERVWRVLEEAKSTGEVVTAMVTERVKGGLRVDVGVPGFVPASQVATRTPRNLDGFVGRELRLRVLEVDRKAKKVVLSHRQVVDEERDKRKSETMAKLYEGAVVEGKVRSLTDYGAFVDLGGVDGLLHISEMSWVRVDKPAELLKVGQRVRVMVLAIEGEGERISLGRRQILPDPWQVIGDKLKPGMVVSARITRVVRNGAFARVEGIEGIELEGFMPMREMADRSVTDAKSIVAAGQVVQAKVVELRPDARKMTLSLTEAEQEREREEYRKVMATRKNTEEERPSALGEALLAAGLTAAEKKPAAGEGEEKPKAKRARKPKAEKAEAEAEAEDAEAEAEAEAAEEAAAVEEAIVEAEIEEAIIEAEIEEAAIEEAVVEAVIEEAILEEAIIEAEIEEAAVEEAVAEAVIEGAIIEAEVEAELEAEAESAVPTASSALVTYHLSGTPELAAAAEEAEAEAEAETPTEERPGEAAE